MYDKIGNASWSFASFLLVPDRVCPSLKTDSWPVTGSNHGRAPSFPAFELRNPEKMPIVFAPEEEKRTSSACFPSSFKILPVQQRERRTMWSG
jgi:hypothetical protein